MTAAMWSTRDELLYWLQAGGTYAAIGVLLVVRFAVAVAFRVIDLALWLVPVVAVLALMLSR